MAAAIADSGLTEYSDVVEGDASNHSWPTRFDVTDGCVGITQSDNPWPYQTSRVLLSPTQVKALLRFVRDHQ